MSPQHSVMRRLIRAVAGVAVLVSVPLSAHHSFSAEFDGKKPIELKGVVTKLEWMNPHVFFYLDVKEGKGAGGNWACETNGPNALVRQGWRRDSLKVGDRVTVAGYLARDGSRFMDARVVTLADGRRIFAATPSADGGPPVR